MDKLLSKGREETAEKGGSGSRDLARPGKKKLGDLRGVRGVGLERTLPTSATKRKNRRSFGEEGEKEKAGVPGRHRHQSDPCQIEQSRKEGVATGPVSTWRAKPSCEVKTPRGKRNQPFSKGGGRR